MQPKGLVLYTTMMTLSIFTLLILTLMQAVFLHVSAVNQLARHHDLFYQLEGVADYLQRAQLENPDNDCLVYDKNPNEMVALLKKQQGCEMTYSKQVFLYSLADLGIEPCLEIQDAYQNRGAHFWLFTIGTKSKPVKILQVRIAKADEVLPCMGATHLIPAGVITWRYLS
jgi:hypothetical protein